MAKEWRIIVQEGDETKLDEMTSCFMVGLANGKKSRVVGGTDAGVGTLASLYLHILEKITEHQEKHPELRETIILLNAIQGSLKGGDDD